ncbi:MAG: sensor histidine kinase [Anaerolineales bacterium]
MITPAWLVNRLEQNFRQSEEKFSTVVRESLDVILVLDPENYRILTVNPTVTPVLGYASDAVIGQSATMFLPPTSEIILEDLAAQSPPGDDLITSLDVIKRDGSICPTDVTATMIPWEDDEEAILVTLRDITERRRREEELHQYREHLEELVEARTAELAATNQRLEAYTQELEASNAELDAFAHTVAHDLKGPIAVITGFSALLVERAPRWPHEKIQETARRIKRTGDRMTSIIDELLLLASVRKQKDIEVGPLSMDRIMAEVRDRLDELIAETHAEIIEPEVWPVAAGYGPWIEEVWTNYLSNALKYGGQPPRVELGAEIREVDPHPIVRFWIRDNGSGLTKEEQAQLFTQFTRLHISRARGHGLGLSIVQRIVKRLNGDVGVESEPGKGSTFYFTLPLINESSDRLLQTG